MTIVAEQYDFVIGVDTHAASHTLALITADTGAVGQHAQFPTSPAGLRRAADWIQRHTQNAPALIVIDGTGSYGAVFAGQLTTAGLTVAEAPDVAAISRRGRGKSDALDAVAMAQAARGLHIDQLRWPRTTGANTILRVLTVAREQMSGERTRAVNALTALLRTVDLGVDARRALTTPTITTIAAWRTRGEDLTLTVCRTETIRLARRIRASTLNSLPITPPCRQQSSSRRHSCLTCPASARSSRRRSCRPGRIPDASARRLRSPPWLAHHRSRPHQATPRDTDSTVAAIADSTEPSTPSH